ncbi:hypothetical protein INR49_008287 [Caranx melampygus]|nr:hypothetical protein INR49_008287 [Caranx melampygus]
MGRKVTAQRPSQPCLIYLASYLNCHRDRGRGRDLHRSRGFGERQQMTPDNLRCPAAPESTRRLDLMDDGCGPTLHPLCPLLKSAVFTRRRI